MGRPGRFKSHFNLVPLVVDDVSVRGAGVADLFAVLQAAPPAAAAGRMGLQKIARAATLAGTGAGKARIVNGGWRMESSFGGKHSPSSICHLPSLFLPSVPT